MKRTAGISISALAWGILFSGFAPADQQQPAGQQETPCQKVSIPTKQTTPKIESPIYKPPNRGSPGGRVAGGTRGARDELPSLIALTPEHTGLTVQEQPTLFWYLSNSTPRSLELTITQDQAIQPLVATSISASLHPGIQGVRLADYGIRLSRGAHYQWWLTLAAGPDNPSLYIFAGGAIERADLPQTLSAKLNKAEKAEAPALYAEAGFWYDAMTAISELIQAAPNDSSLRAQRAALLEQVGLGEAAACDFSQTKED